MEKDKRRAVYILLTQTGTLLNKTIKKYTDAPYNHVSLGFDVGLKELYSFGRKHPRNPLFGGFVREDVYYGTYRYFPKTTCTLLRCEVTIEEWRKMKHVVDYFKQRQQFYKYNFIGLFGVVFNYPVAFRDSYFCSQFVAEVFKRSGMVLWDKPTALVTPNDFLQHPLLEVIYEGNLYDFPLLLSTELHIFQPFSYRKKLFYNPYKKIKDFFLGSGMV